MFEGARTEVLDDDVGRRREPPEDVLTIAGAQVERHALAAAPFNGPEQRVTVDEGPDLAHEVAAARLLDLDDLRALLAEQARAERRCDARAQIEDAQALERTGHDRPCSFLTASMPPALRASTLARAVGVFDTNW